MSKQNKKIKSEQPEKKQEIKEKNKSLTKVKGKEKIEDKKLKSFFTKLISIIKNKWLVKASTTFLLVLIIFAIYIGGTKILDIVSIPDIDATTDKLYSLSDETKNRIKDIEQDVKITLINYGNNDATKNMMEQYKATNKKITLEYIDDITARIDIQQKYSIEQTDTLIIVSSDKEEVQLNSYDLMSYDYSTYKQVDLTEEAVTNAIINVTATTKPKIYYINNHIMYAFDKYYEEVKNVLEGDANKVEGVNLLTTGSVPEDCDTLIITTLKEDISEIERDYIINYINNGGKLLLMCGPNILKADLSNFNSILELYGIKIEEGILFEGDANKMLSGFPDIMIEDVKNGSLTKNKELNLNAFLVDACSIILEEDEDKINELGVTYEKLINTSETAFVRNDLYITSASRTSKDSEAGTYNAGVLATKQINEEKSSQLILYSADMFSQIQLQNYILSAGNNKDIIANSIAYLNKKENTITIRKNYDYTKYSVSQNQHNIIVIIIFATPIAIIMAGIIIWRVRKRKK